MPGKSSAMKRHRQNITHRMRNRIAKSTILSSKKKFLASVSAGDADTAGEDLKRVVKLIDTAASKGLYHKNTAARKKSRLYKKLNQLKAQNKA